MLISADDVVASIHELDGSSDPLEFIDTKSSSTGCPRCHHPMSECKLALGKLKLAGTFLRCDRDGIWFPRDAMTAVFARVSRRSGFRGLGAVGSGGGRATGGTAGSGSARVVDMPDAHGGWSGPMASIQGAFGASPPASSGLAISRWHDRRPRVHTLFVSAHKERRLGCP